MKKILIILLLIINTIAIWSIDLDILNITINNDTLMLEVKINSVQEVYLPENVVQAEIFKRTDPFGRSINIFYGVLKLNNRGNYTLILSNEIAGLYQYIKMPFGNAISLSTIDTKYISFSNKELTSIILIDKVFRPIEGIKDENAENIKVDEVYLEFCFSTDLRLKNKKPGDLADKIIPIENIIKTIICSYRLKLPLMLNQDMISY